MEKTFEAEVGGKKLVIGSGRYAQQTNGSVTVQYGDTKVLATVVMSDDVRGEVDYFPLMVDYEEKLYAAGKIKGSRFIKKEGRPSDEAVISSRVIDRALRPLFPQHIRNDIQVIVDVLSFDEENDPDIPALIAASCALTISDIPFSQIMAAVRVGQVDGELVLNPTFAARQKSIIDLILAVTGEGKVIMVEAGAKEADEETFLTAVEFGKKHVKKVIDLIAKAQKEIGKEKKDLPAPEIDEKLKQKVEELASAKLNDILFTEQKTERKKIIYNLGDEIVAQLIEEFGEEQKINIKNTYFATLERLISEGVFKDEKRIGGRKMDEIRTLDIEAGALPRVHGSGYFMRGETQVLTITTLGSPGKEQIIDGMEEEYKKRFMHHYNFPPFSVGEVQPLRGPSRRDIGHGALAEKALEAVVPDKEDFPYTIRLVSEVLGSNGSSSMASTCGSSLALMDAGVPIKKAVAGIAMGLVQNGNGDYKILTDLQDLEDTVGGMDFKVAGTTDGITAVQMDTKTHGLTDDMVADTFAQAKKARLELLEAMNKVIDKPRPELSEYAPRIVTFKINPEKIRDVIGPGGKMINAIIDKTGVEIDIEDDGSVTITSVDEKKMQEARTWVDDLTKEAELGEEYTGKVVRIMDFGAFVEIFPGTDGMIHISKLSKQRVNKVEDVVKMGDTVKVKVIEIDEMGRINLALIDK
ncbi:polyribonucleotide nucleotidyltransferase [Patescibacteria group bacterium]|nr:polyribonucleotide nucleotidyltransferase [Patescibacteria group bacterium]